MPPIGIELILSIVKEERIQDFIELKPELFVDFETELFEFTQNFYTSYGVLPSEAVLNDQFTYSFTEISTPFAYLLDEVNKRHLKRNLSDLISKASSSLHTDPEASFLLLKESLFGIETARLGVRDEIIPFSKLSSIVVEDIKQTRSKSGLTGIDAGWPTLNKITHGYQNGDIYVYVARVKAGKSVCLMYSADAAHKSGSVPLLISMEMKIKQFAKRHLSLRSSIGHNFLKSGLLSGFAEQALNRTVEEIKRQHPFYYVEGQLSKGISELTSLIHMYRPNIVFIDGGYLMDVDSFKRSRWEEMEVLMKQMKSLAIRSDIPIVVTFQFKRDMLKKKQSEVGLEDIRLSDDIGAIASVGIGIFDKSPYETNIAEDVVTSRKYLDVIGGREGETGGFYINWDWDRMNFTESDPSSTVYPGLEQLFSSPIHNVMDLIE